MNESFSVLSLSPEYLSKLEKRFWAKVEKTEGCWIWKACIIASGYGQFSVRRIDRIYSHRVSYELFKGKIPDGLTIDHLCRNRACVNPEHLEVVTGKENILRGQSPPAENARKTHCPKGHPLSGDNLIICKFRTGKRQCKICRYEMDKIRRERINMKSPADMSFSTLKNYYYDSACLTKPNLVFPIQLSKAVRQDKKRPDKSQMDSRPKSSQPRTPNEPLEIER